MSIVREHLRRQDASFISLRETLELMTKEGEGCTPKEAARCLLYCLLHHEDTPELLSRSIDGRFLIEDRRRLSNLLNQVIISGKVEDEIPF